MIFDLIEKIKAYTKRFFKKNILKDPRNFPDYVSHFELSSSDKFLTVCVDCFNNSKDNRIDFTIRVNQVKSSYMFKYLQDDINDKNAIKFHAFKDPDMIVGIEYEYFPDTYDSFFSVKNIHKKNRCYEYCNV